MATKKAASAKKSRTTPKKQATTKVTTVKADTATTAKSTTAAKTATVTTKGRAILQGRSPLLGAFIGEFVGTFILATVALIVSGNALLVGFALVALVLVIGAVSGSHVNPLITVGAWVTRKISGKRALGYVGAQILGAMLALVVMTAFSSAAPTADDAQQNMMMMQQTPQLFQMEPITSETKGTWYVFFAEILGAAILGFVVASAMRERRERTAQAFTFGLGYFAALTVAGGAASFATLQVIINPALALSMQAIAWPIQDVWSILVYVIAPIVGGVAGFFLYDLVRSQNASSDDTLLHHQV
jgi:aquaporin Z